MQTNMLADILRGQIFIRQLNITLVYVNNKSHHAVVIKISHLTPYGHIHSYSYVYIQSEAYVKVEENEIVKEIKEKEVIEDDRLN